MINIDMDAIFDRVTDRVMKLAKQELESKPAPLLVDATELARQLSVSKATVERLVREKAIPSVRIGARRLFSPQRVLECFPDE